ncbi:MAG TPA: type 4a pilus biogenesis protein PilO [Planctomycetaceae bacterium]|nr:type 4a pilus biogenesis protein PilO [Planctomycetaceae bacterium]
MSRLDDASDARLSRAGGWLHAAGLAVAAALFAAVYIPAIGALHSQQAGIAAQTDAATQLLDSAEALRREHADLVARQAEVQTRTGQLLSRIPETPQESEFLAHIARLAHQSPLAVRNFRPVATTDYDHYSEIEVHLTAVASYEGLCRFLAGLESLPRLCTVKRFSIVSEPAAQVVVTPAASGALAATWPVEITLTIYFTPPPGSAEGRHRRAP